MDSTECVEKRQSLVMMIAGPTCVGKTSIAVEVALRLGAEVISADSVQLYRNANVGVAKASECERRGVTHHLLDDFAVDSLAMPDEYLQRVRCILPEIRDRDSFPLICGGTGMYFSMLLRGIAEGPRVDFAVRDALEKRCESEGLSVLYSELLNGVDKAYALKVGPNDRKRIIRALEIFKMSNGRAISSFAANGVDPVFSDGRDNVRCWFLTRPREVLKRRINARTCQMLEHDKLIDEVLELKRQGLERNKSAAKAIGYRQTLEWLLLQEESDQEGDLDILKERINAATWQYARRQLTWFRKEDTFRWIDIEEIGEQAVVDFIVKDYNECMNFSSPTTTVSSVNINY